MGRALIGVWRCLPLLFVGCIVVAPPAVRPRWRTTDAAELDAGCATAHAFIRKSGKTGFGFAVQWKSKGDCEVTLAGAELVFPDGVHLATNPGRPRLAMKGRSLLYDWLPIEFDNNDVWNEDRNIAIVEIAVVVGTAKSTWKIPVEQKP